MKKILLLIALALPLLAVAGPEDHIPTAVYTTSASVPYYLLSFEGDAASISIDGNNLVIEARYGNLDGEYRIVSSSRQNEDKVNFKAEKVIINKWESGCGEGEFAKLVISGQIYGDSVDIRALDLSVEYSTTNDTCHSRPQTSLIKYNLEK